MIGDLNETDKLLARDHWRQHRLAQTCGLRNRLKTKFAPCPVIGGVTRGDQPAFLDHFFRRAFGHDRCSIYFNNVTRQPLKWDLTFECSFVGIVKKKTEDIHGKQGGNAVD